jgi:HEAT repeat protein
MEGDGPAETVPGLVELERALASANPAQRRAALARVQPRWGLEQAVIDALADQDPEVRRASARALGRLDGPNGIRALIRASAGDLSASVRAEAIVALSRILSERLSRAQSAGQGEESPSAANS